MDIYLIIKKYFYHIFKISFGANVIGLTIFRKLATKIKNCILKIQEFNIEIILEMGLFFN